MFLDGNETYRMSKMANVDEKSIMLEDLGFQICQVT